MRWLELLMCHGEQRTHISVNVFSSLKNRTEFLLGCETTDWGVLKTKGRKWASQKEPVTERYCENG